MTAEKAEKLGSLFLAVFATGYAAVLAADGMDPGRWPHALVAILASLALAITVRVWPRPEPVKAKRD
jgi:hypothetical protein